MSARRIALLLALALAEAALATPLVRALVPLPPAFGPAGTLALVWLVIGGLAVQWQILSRRGTSLVMQRALMGGWLIVLVVAIEADIFLSAPSVLPNLLTMAPGFLIALGLWWRGMALGTNELKPRDAELHLQLGLLIFLLLGFATLFSPDLEIWVYLAGFFAGSLAAIPLANLEYTHTSDIGRRTPMTPGWWAWVIGAVGLVLIAGFMFTAVMSGRPVVSLLAALLTIALLPLALIGTLVLALIPQAFFDALAALLQRLGSVLGSLQQFGQDEQTQALLEEGNAGIVVPAQISFLIGLIAFGALVALVIYLMRQAKRNEAAPHTEKADAEGALRQSSAANGAAQERFGLGALRQWLATITIRRLYARATREAARRGHARGPTQTPFEYLPELQRAYPAAEAEARAITHAYVAAHYGEVPDSPEALRALTQAWERMRGTPRSL